MATVSDLATRYNVSTSTIRAWTEEFHTFLELEHEKDKTRIYSAKDESVLALVAAMRTDGLPYSQIHSALEAGERYEAPPEEKGPAPLATQREIELAFNLAQMEGRYGQLEEERDHLRSELQGEREARIDAEKRASAAEGKLEVIEDQQSQHRSDQSKVAADASERRPWWKRLF